jgi:hypothetical protein
LYGVSRTCYCPSWQGNLIGTWLSSYHTRPYGHIHKHTQTHTNTQTNTHTHTHRYMLNVECAPLKDSLPCIHSLVPVRFAALRLQQLQIREYPFTNNNIQTILHWERNNNSNTSLIPSCRDHWLDIKMSFSCRSFWHFNSW